MSGRVFRAKLLARDTGTYESFRRYTFNVVATSIDVAVRMVRRAAKRDGLQVRRFLKVKDLGPRDA